MNNSPQNQSRQNAFKTAINDFLQKRLNAKLDKLPPDDPKRVTLQAQFRPDAWIKDAAHRVSRIHAATHSLKATYPNAKALNTSLYCEPRKLRAYKELGSHSIDADIFDDIVGDAAVLDVYTFLCTEANGSTLLGAILKNDSDLKAAFSNDDKQAQEWMNAFSGLMEQHGEIASHTRAKQIYWLTGDDPCNDNHYRLLSPLYANTFAHAMYLRIQEDRFSEATKAAKQARRDGQDHPNGYADYPNLAILKLGGSNPQNISRLNNQRRGNNYLLASLPPSWKSRNVREPWHKESVFTQFGARPMVRSALNALCLLLNADPTPTMATRDQRDSLTDDIIDELILFGQEMQQGLTAGWSAKPQCQLVQVERLWLDPYRTITDDDFRKTWVLLEWPDEIGKRFGNWLNKELSGLLPVGEIEHRHWTRELLGDQEWTAELDLLRRQISALEPLSEGERA